MNKIRSFCIGIVFTVILLMAGAATFIGLSQIRDIYKQSAETKDSNKKIAEMIDEPQVVGDGTAKIKDTKYADIKSAYPDVKGWITAPALGVDLPIMTYKGDYYLNHSYDDTKIKSGALFYSEDELTIYGHHMKDGTMFGKLQENVDILNYIIIDEIKDDGTYRQKQYKVKDSFTWDTRDDKDYDIYEGDLKLTTCDYSIEYPYGRFTVVLEEI